MKLRNKKTGEIRDGEDYEEPKDIWWIDNEGNVIHATSEIADKFHRCREIGNHFSSREEAEKAVEKLKAWKRLKDTYHIRFDLDFVKNTISFTYRIDDTLHSVVDEERIVFEDLKTIFGGEDA